MEKRDYEMDIERIYTLKLYDRYEWILCSRLLFSVVKILWYLCIIEFLRLGIVGYILRKSDIDKGIVHWIPRLFFRV